MKRFRNVPLLGAMALELTMVSSLFVLLPGAASGQPKTTMKAGAALAPTTSMLAGIPLPRGAERLADPKVVEQATAPLAKIADDMATPMRLQATEVIGWGGTGYDRQTGTKIIAQVRAALGKNGFQIQKAGEPQTAQGSMISFFIATSAQKNKTLVGYWVESDTLLMLAWGQFASADAAPSNGPAKGADEGAAVSGLPKFPSLRARPNEATGTVLTMPGKPIAGARIRFWRVTPQGAIIEYVARTDAQGVYTIKLPPSDQYRIDNATALVSYGVQRYYLPLRPERGDGSFFDGEAINISRGYVRNFVLPISGRISPEEDPKDPLAYYGGSILFTAYIPVVVPGDPAMSAGATRPNSVPEGTKIELTLTPQGPLIDGSAGRPLRWNLQVRNNGRNAYSETLKDIPLGVYTATARVKTPDGNTFTPALSARIGVVNGISSPFITDSQSPIFFGPRWETWPMENGNLEASRHIKRSNQGGASSVWLEIGSR